MRENVHTRKKKRIKRKKNNCMRAAGLMKQKNEKR